MRPSTAVRAIKSIGEFILGHIASSTLNVIFKCHICIRNVLVSVQHLSVPFYVKKNQCTRKLYQTKNLEMKTEVERKPMLLHIIVSASVM